MRPELQNNPIRTDESSAVVAESRKPEALMKQFPIRKHQNNNFPVGEIFPEPTNIATRKKPQAPAAEINVVRSEKLPSGKNA